MAHPGSGFEILSGIVRWKPTMLKYTEGSQYSPVFGRLKTQHCAHLENGSLPHVRGTRFEDLIFGRVFTVVHVVFGYTQRYFLQFFYAALANFEPGQVGRLRSTTT